MVEVEQQHSRWNTASVRRKKSSKKNNEALEY